MLTPPQHSPRRRACRTLAVALPLRELEPAPRTRLAILLPLHHSSIAGEEPGLLHRRTKLRIPHTQRAGKAVADGTGLPRQASAPHIDRHVHLPGLLKNLERLVDHHLRGLAAEVILKGSAVHGHHAGARLYPDAGNRLFPPAGRVESAVVCFRHHLISAFSTRTAKRYALTSRGTGC